MHYFIICSVGNYDEYIKPYYVSAENSLLLDSCHTLQNIKSESCTRGFYIL